MYLALLSSLLLSSQIYCSCLVTVGGIFTRSGQRGPRSAVRHGGARHTKPASEKRLNADCDSYYLLFVGTLLLSYSGGFFSRAGCLEPNGISRQLYASPRRSIITCSGLVFVIHM